MGKKYTQQFDVEDDILVMYIKLENKLYTLKHQEKHKQITILDWLKNEFNSVLILQMIAIS